MKILIIGAGRMGVRHAQGVISLSFVEEVCLVDIKKEALDNARNLLGTSSDVNKMCFKKLDVISHEQGKYDVCIIATTAGDRKSLCNLAIRFGCKNLMVEKPLGQSFSQVLSLVDEMEKMPLSVVVNLNMRLYESFKELRSDLALYPQMQGEKVITVNTGTLGIGCNGIHYLDLIYFLLDADRAELVAGEIDETTIPSGRGCEFCDFGGWSTIKFYRAEKYLGRAIISMSSTSTLFGSWDIVGPHGKIALDEIAGVRVDTLRKVDSSMPISRYAADYLPPVSRTIRSPFLGDLTAEWVRGLNNGMNLLPKISDSLRVHRLMFDWLEKSPTHKSIFPIT